MSGGSGGSASGASGVSLTTKGDLLTFDTAETRLPVSATNGYILTVNSAVADGIEWAAAAAASSTAILRIPLQIRTPEQTANLGNSFFNVTGLTDYDAGNYEFVKDVDGKLFGSVRIPNNMNSTPAAKIILTYMANATSGVTRLSVASTDVADGESMNPSSLTSETAVDSTVPTTAYLRKDVSFTMTNTPVADDIKVFEIYHEGAHGSDTLAANTILVSAVLEITVDV